MDRSFTSGRYRFQIDRRDWVSDEGRTFHEELEDETFDLRLTATGRIPDLDRAPLASWILARLARLTDGALGLGGEEYNEGGGYVVEFVAYVEPETTKTSFVQPLLFDMIELGIYVEPARPVAAFQFQADMQGAAVLGCRAADCPAEKVLEAFAAVPRAPEALTSRELVVIDPEWEAEPEMYRPWPCDGSRNWYGWDGSQFLGQDNIREADCQD